MSVSILEALENAEVNLQNAQRGGQIGALGLGLAGEQLHNAVTLLEKGYGIYQEVGPLLEEFGAVENVPEKPEE